MSTGIVLRQTDLSVTSCHLPHRGRHIGYEESLLARLYALIEGATRCCEAKAQSDGTDAGATKLSPVD